MKRLGAWNGFIWPTIRISDGWAVVHRVMKGEKLIYQPRDLHSAPQSKLQTDMYLS
jgi:hypothetical protein